MMSYPASLSFLTVLMASKRFILNSARSARQGSLINVGKDSAEYQALTTSMMMCAEDMAEIGLAEGQPALVRTEFGESRFICEKGKVPVGIIVVPYGPPTCRLMGGDTDGTGMPTSKGWEVEVIPLERS
ncbi:MAG TPA: formylmethanofuran dehydrogenase [Planctomycetaceae bacterium]|jgi:formylmethanofuran dehydrogenase subunit D|nr:formylmethanofuran dehydrogenase [Planctomycetaceae bacterium]